MIWLGTLWFAAMWLVFSVLVLIANDDETGEDARAHSLVGHLMGLRVLPTGQLSSSEGGW